MPMWAAVAKTHVFRIRNLLLKWRRKATATDARQPKIKQWLSSEARERRSTPGAASRLTVQQAQVDARASRTRCRARSAGHTASLQSTMRRWVHGAPNGTNDSDQTPPEEDPVPEPTSPGPTSVEAARSTAADTGPATAAHGAADFGMDLDWLPEPGRTQAMHGRAAAYDDTGRCAYHRSPLGCTLLDGEHGNGTGLIERYGRKSELPSSGAPVVPRDPPTAPTDPQPNAAPEASESSAEVRKRSADLMAWCERCAVGIHFYCANDHALEHAEDDCNGYYRAKDIAASWVSATTARLPTSPT